MLCAFMCCVQHLAHDRDRLRHRHRPFGALGRDRERRQADMGNAGLVGDVGHRDASDGVIDEPMMMSALDSVTKRRALVVAVVGSPPSSSTITFSGTPPISLGTNSSALRSGMPSAAPGPVVVIEMPMVISLVCASAGSARQRQRRRDRRRRTDRSFSLIPPFGCCSQPRSEFAANSAPSLGDAGDLVSPA